MSALSLVPVRESDRERAISTLVSAFSDDPVQRWLFPDSQQYLAHFPEFVAASAGKAFDQETVWSLGDSSAVALWLPPGVERDADMIVSVLSENVSPEKHGDVFSVLEQMDEAHPNHSHWYLSWLGVERAQQGLGLGGRLLKHCLTIIDESHLPAYLRTPNPRTISFYERHGFEVTAVAQAGTCPPVTLMLRTAP
jgi:ribosomal protein S18 acetylase RimI-like enzyme